MDVRLSGIQSDYEPVLEEKSCSVNEQEQRNVKNDSYEKTQYSIYENYGDWSKVKKRAESPLGSSLGDEVFHDSAKCLLDYYQGKCTMGQVKDFMKQCCETVIEYRTWASPEKEISEEEKQSIIGTVYALFESQSVDRAVYQCFLEGKRINSQEGYKDNNDFAYYDSDIYYKCKDMKSELLNYTNVFSSELLEEKVDYSEYKNKTYFEKDFHDSWNNLFTTNIRTAKVIDCSAEPPKNFKFFFKDSPYSKSNDIYRFTSGRVKISIAGETSEGDVPFEPAIGGVQGLEKQIFNMNSLLDILDAKASQEVKTFAKNILVFKGQYGYTYKEELKNW